MKKINFKRTWSVILIMIVFLSLLALTSASIDYVLSHANDYKDFLDQQFIDKYTCQDLLTIVHISYFISLITSLILVTWYMLWNLFIKKNKNN